MDIISTIVESLQQMLTGSVEAISSGFNALFFTGEGENQTLSTLGIVLLTFVGLGMAVGLTYVILNLFRK